MSQNGVPGNQNGNLGSQNGVPAGQNGQSRSKRSRRRGANRSDPWAPAPLMPELAPIERATDPTAVLRSLGDPPLQGRSIVAGHYLAAVTERAATLATALATAAGLLVEPQDDDEDH